MRLLVVGLGDLGEDVVDERGRGAALAVELERALGVQVRGLAVASVARALDARGLDQARRGERGVGLLLGAAEQRVDLRAEIDRLRARHRAREQRVVLEVLRIGLLRGAHERERARRVIQVLERDPRHPPLDERELLGALHLLENLRLELVEHEDAGPVARLRVDRARAIEGRWCRAGSS